MSVPESYRNHADECCKNCEYFSFKVFTQQGPYSGKCFVDCSDESRIVYYVSAFGVCDRFRREEVDEE